MDERRCSKCKQMCALSSFAKYRNRKGELAYRACCNACRALKEYGIRSKNPEKARATVRAYRARKRAALGDAGYRAWMRQYEPRRSPEGYAGGIVKREQQRKQQIEAYAQRGYLDVGALAAKYHYTRRTVLYWINQGYVEAVEDWQWFVNEESVKQYLAGRS